MVVVVDCVERCRIVILWDVVGRTVYANGATRCHRNDKLLGQNSKKLNLVL